VIPATCGLFAAVPNTLNHVRQIKGEEDMRPWTSRALASVLAAAMCVLPTGPAFASGPGDTATPINHVVVIFQENVSFDHYFATYPTATNPGGEPAFHAQPGTPTVNGLSGVLLTNNPNNNNPANSPNQTNPFRLDRTQASTCDQGHSYGPEQASFDGGLMDAFPLDTGAGGSSFCMPQFAYGKGKGLVMGYFDGNTVTALWNYAQHFAMNDNSYSSTFGPSTPGLLNLVAGNTYPATPSAPSTKVVPNNAGPGTLVGDLDPTGDVCSAGTTVQLGGKNIGDLLNANGVTWGSFMGGFDLTATNPDGSTGCNRQSPASASNGGPTKDYIPHHSFFNYYASTANPAHTRPASVSEIGNNGQANHQYDINDFFTALQAGNLPAVSFLKAIAAQDGHAGYSDPLLEQAFVVKTVNSIMNSRDWKDTAIIIMYDDSDGWYDHQMSPIVNSSAVLQAASLGNSDQLNGPGKCGNGTPLAGAAGPIEGRCGYGPRQPFLVVSPFAKKNFVDGTLTDQSSVIRFVEDNWSLGQIGGGSFDQFSGSLLNMFDFSHDRDADDNRLILDPTTGQPAHDHDRR
jgi:phospholipase C